MPKENISYLCTFPSEVMEQIEYYARQNNKEKNEVITEAVMLFITEKRKRELAETFELAKNDKELMFLAETC